MMKKASDKAEKECFSFFVFLSFSLSPFSFCPFSFFFFFFFFPERLFFPFSFPSPFLFFSLSFFSFVFFFFPFFLQKVIKYVIFQFNVKRKKGMRKGSEIDSCKSEKKKVPEKKEAKKIQVNMKKI